MPIRHDVADRKNCIAARCALYFLETGPTPLWNLWKTGRGSNLQAIIDAIGDGRLHAAIALVVANVPSARGLERARTAGLPTREMPHQLWPSRAAYDAAVADALRAARVDLVCLAGFMRLLTPAFLDAFPHRVLNVHPSLLPAFPGVDAQRQALAHGVAVSGATVHFVTPELDAGPIIRQAAVPVLPGDTVESLSARILVEEHRLYPEAIAAVLAGRWRVEGRRFIEDTPAVP
jgi:phosphoribosylglycinamide formyltransferase-1